MSFRFDIDTWNSIYNNNKKTDFASIISAIVKTLKEDTFSTDALKQWQSLYARQCDAGDVWCPLSNLVGDNILSYYEIK